MRLSLGLIVGLRVVYMSSRGYAVHLCHPCWRASQQGGAGQSGNSICQAMAAVQRPSTALIDVWEINWFVAVHC